VKWRAHYLGSPKARFIAMDLEAEERTQRAQRQGLGPSTIPELTTRIDDVDRARRCVRPPRAGYCRGGERRRRLLTALGVCTCSHVVMAVLRSVRGEVTRAHRGRGKPGAARHTLIAVHWVSLWAAFAPIRGVYQPLADSTASGRQIYCTHLVVCGCRVLWMGWWTVRRSRDDAPVPLLALGSGVEVQRLEGVLVRWRCARPRGRAAAVRFAVVVRTGVRRASHHSPIPPTEWAPHCLSYVLCLYERMH
jgi:hypothetical protein